jgi:hypothetical protein
VLEQRIGLKNRIFLSRCTGGCMIKMYFDWLATLLARAVILPNRL